MWFVAESSILLAGRAGRDIGAECTRKIFDIVVLAKFVVRFFKTGVGVFIVSGLEEKFVAVGRDTEAGVLVDRVNDVKEDMIVKDSSLKPVVLNFVRRKFIELSKFIKGDERGIVRDFVG